MSTETEDLYEQLEIYVGPVADTVEKKIEAYRKLRDFLVEDHGLNRDLVASHLLDHVMPQALIHSGPGLFKVKINYKLRDHHLFPNYTILNDADYTPGQIAEIERATIETLSEEHVRLIQELLNE